MSIHLYGLTEFAKELGVSADRRKLSVYYSRGKFPNPTAFAGANRRRPLWTKEQIEQFKKTRNVRFLNPTGIIKKTEAKRNQGDD